MIQLPFLAIPDSLLLLLLSLDPHYLITDLTLKAIILTLTLTFHPLCYPHYSHTITPIFTETQPHPYPYLPPAPTHSHSSLTSPSLLTHTFPSLSPTKFPLSYYLHISSSSINSLAPSLLPHTPVSTLIHTLILTFISLPCQDLALSLHLQPRLANDLVSRLS